MVIPSDLEAAIGRKKLFLFAQQRTAQNFIRKVIKYIIDLQSFLLRVILTICGNMYQVYTVS